MENYRYAARTAFILWKINPAANTIKNLILPRSLKLLATIIGTELIIFTP